MGWIALPDELKTFVSPHGRRAAVTVFKGRVAGTSTWSETHVTSSGGGGSGYVDPQHGGHIQVQAPVISSYVTENREFFLTDGGKEQSYKFTNADFPIREGHVVSAIYVAPDKTRPLVACAVNHATDQRIALILARSVWDRLTNTLEVYKRNFVEFTCHPMMIFFVSIVDVFFVGLERCAIFAGIAGAIRVYTHFWDKWVVRNCANALGAHLEAVAKFVAATPLQDEQLRPHELSPPIAPVYAAAPASRLAAAGR